MTDADRELIELAAEAAGVCLHPAHMLHRSYGNWGCDTTCMICKEDPSDAAWHPLTSDADAMRLAVKLDLTVRHYSGSTVAQSGAPGTPCAYEEVSNHADPCAAARRAIVQAAAVIGRTLSQAPGAAPE